MIGKSLGKRMGWAGYGILMSLLVAGNSHAAEKAQLTNAPNVPAPIKRTSPATVVVNFEAKEYVGDLGEGIKYKFWSFNGTVPGPMVRVRVGDTVEFHLSNDKKSTQVHNIDIHAVTGPGGGAHVNDVDPGKERIFKFKTLAPGLYIYHCASGGISSIPMHIANGMYGLILVEPEGGLPPVDREYYVMQSEFYLKESDDDPGIYELDYDKGGSENPDRVVFNGKVGGLLEDNVLKAKVGETVRIYFGNIGPNKISSLHMIGEIFDKVYVGGAIGGLVNKNVQTTLVPAAGAAIVEFKVDVPATYVLVDHSIFRITKGAIGMLSAEGKEDPSIFKSIK
ncbi:MAG: copper-containing nitrite reductase [Nitrospinaceae bacterium]|nr:MAG: copper-containing nitrite reductase [Nitrospinaceae bacterium]